MGADYWPYRARRGDRAELGKPYGLGEETALIEMPISWSLDDFPHFEFMRTPTMVLPGLQSARTVGLGQARRGRVHGSAGAGEEVWADPDHPGLDVRLVPADRLPVGVEDVVAAGEQLDAMARAGVLDVEEERLADAVLARSEVDLAAGVAHDLPGPQDV